MALSLMKMKKYCSHVGITLFYLFHNLEKWFIPQEYYWDPNSGDSQPQPEIESCISQTLVEHNSQYSVPKSDPCFSTPSRDTPCHHPSNSATSLLVAMMQSVYE
eukprot:3670500-Ditylum_brightwellii.AAC.1